jgi:hypothetical protein
MFKSPPLPYIGTSDSWSTGQQVDPNGFDRAEIEKGSTPSNRRATPEPNGRPDVEMDFYDIHRSKPQTGQGQGVLEPMGSYSKHLLLEEDMLVEDNRDRGEPELGKLSYEISQGWGTVEFHCLQ